jgi:hypothetical protein
MGGRVAHLFIRGHRPVCVEYRGSDAEVETELALFRPNLHGFYVSSEHSAEVNFLSRDPGLRPLEAALPWANIGPPRWGFSCRFAGEVISRSSSSFFHF